MASYCEHFPMFTGYSYFTVWELPAHFIDSLTDWVVCWHLELWVLKPSIAYTASTTFLFMWSFLLLYRSSLITWDPICQSLALFSKQYKVLAYAAILKRFCALSSIGVLGLPLALLPVNTQSQYTVTMDLQDTPDPYPPKHRHHFISMIVLLHD